MIGKFGIGKLATYAIANKISYLSHHTNGTFYVSCDFSRFESAPEGAASEAVELTVREISDRSVLLNSLEFEGLCASIGLEPRKLTDGSNTSWTICILEGLKPKAADLKRGRLKWVIRTAMPLKTDFRVFVEGDRIERGSETLGPIVEFGVGDLDESRLGTLNRDLAEDRKWRLEDGALVSNLFPSGVTGEVMVTKRSLVRGKSVDLGRSHGFFVYVRDRLVNQEDELFGLHALSHATFNFFRADIRADDLHSDVTTPREGIEHGEKRELAADLLLSLFNDARQRQQAQERSIEEGEKRKPEHERVFVPPRLVDQPIADTLAMVGMRTTGTDADEGWFFLRDVEEEERESIVERLYDSGPKQYEFTYDRIGKTERLVKLDPGRARFTLNEDHEVVLAYSDDARSRQLLEDLVTSEVLLEVYLREAGVNPYVIGEVLERRDLLMRSLAQDRVYSLESIAQSLVDSKDDKHDLEVALVAASRALGFNAKHIGGSGEPDGVARFNDYKNGEIKITLEAKSSSGVPELSSLDFAGLVEHKGRYGAEGCLVVAPAYPGEKGRERSGGAAGSTAVEERAIEGQISCWLVEDLAAVVRATESHQITATQILDIVCKAFRPRDVRSAVKGLLEADSVREYYREIMNALRALDGPGKLERSARTVQHISAALSLNSDLEGVTDEKVRSALVQMSNISRGMVRISRDRILFSGDVEEFARRVASLTGESGIPRKLGSFRNGEGGQ